MLISMKDTNGILVSVNTESLKSMIFEKPKNNMVKVCLKWLDNEELEFFVYYETYEFISKFLDGIMLKQMMVTFPRENPEELKFSL
jgi:hypothetical protein